MYKDWKSVRIPMLMQKLEKDHRGYPVPVIIQKDREGKPHFTINNEALRQKAIHDDTCPICGNKLWNIRWLVGGPLSAMLPNGWFIDTAMHHECMTYALTVCPYLAMPSYTKRVEGGTMSALERAEFGVLIDPTMLPAKPDVFVAIAFKKEAYRHKHNLTFPGYNGTMFVQHVKAEQPYLGMEFWKDGEKLSPDEGSVMALEYVSRKMQELGEAK